jgi:uncharacterized protein (DUF433 family)
MPIGPVPHILIAPDTLSGEPCLGNHRLPIAMIGEHVRTVGVTATMRDYTLTRAEVLTACWFLGAYGITRIHKPGRHRRPARYRVTQDGRTVRKWRKWAERNAAAFWDGHYSEIPDPPLPRALHTAQTADLLTQPVAV